MGASTPSGAHADPPGRARGRRRRPVEELPTLERPASARGRLARLRARLARSNTAIGNALLVLLSRGGLDEEAWEEVEDTLIRADLGVDATTELVDSCGPRSRSTGRRDREAEVKAWLKADLLDLVDPEMDRRIASSRIDGRPAVVLVVGVNGTGKTTTVGKLARVLVSEDRDVSSGRPTRSAPPPRTSSRRGARGLGSPRSASEKEGADPAAVAFDAVKAAGERGGRRHHRHRRPPAQQGRPHGRAGQGQAGHREAEPDRRGAPRARRHHRPERAAQAEVFSEAVKVTGIVLTKLDGTAKGGIVVAVQRQLGVPVKLVGLGEGPDDLAPFDAEAFVDAIVG